MTKKKRRTQGLATSIKIDSISSSKPVEFRPDLNEANDLLLINITSSTISSYFSLIKINLKLILRKFMNARTMMRISK